MKTILASMTNLDGFEDVIKTASALASIYDGHVIGHYPIPEGSAMALANPAGMVPFDDTVKKLYIAKKPGIRDQFLEHFSKSEISHEWREEQRSETYLTPGTLSHGRQSDIIVVGQDEAGSKSAAYRADYLGDVILGSGRPVIVVPPLNRQDISFDRIAVGWNGSRESARAVFDSLPILQAAKDVFLIWVNPEKARKKAGDLPGTELATSLARHGVKVTAQGLSGRKKTAQAISEYIAANEVDLLVLGAYGHTRLREQLFGGVTDYFIKNANCPVLFSN